MIDGLKDEQRTALIEVLSANERVERVVLFGSRATQTHSATSDIDIALFGKNLTRTDLARLAETVDELPYPHKVDLLVYKSIRNDAVRDEIDTHSVEWFNRRVDCPTASLADVADITISNVDKKTKAGEIPVRLCNYTDVYYNQYIRSDMDFMHATATERELSRCSLFAGDVVITKDSEKDDDIGVPAYINEDIDDLVCGYHLVILRPKSDKIDGAYLFYSLNAREAQHQFHARANGVTRFGLRKTDIGTVTVPVPPLHEQRRIAHILGTLDDKIELNRRMNETLEEMARAVFKDWFADFGPVRAKMEGGEAYLPEEVWRLFPDRLVESELGEVPEGWGVKALGEIANVVYGAPFASKRFNDDRQGVPLIRIRDLLNCDPSVFTDEVHPKGHVIEPGDIVVGMDGEFKAYYWLGEQAWLNQRVCHFEPLDGVPQVFLRESIAEPLALLERSKVGTTVIHLGKRDIDNFEIVVPPADILIEFGRATDGLIDRIKANATETRSLATKRGVLLPRLVSGEVSVQSRDQVVN